MFFAVKKYKIEIWINFSCSLSNEDLAQSLRTISVVEKHHAVSVVFDNTLEQNSDLIGLTEKS